MSKRQFQKTGVATSATLIAGAIVAAISLFSILALPLVNNQEASMHLVPERGVYPVGSTFTMLVSVAASTPVNVFAGELRFDPAVLQVQSIDYNTSIANLWAERPWYENGAGTLNFAGGTTRKGGFSGEGVLLTATFQTVGSGDTELSMVNARILKHDGLGTDVELEGPIDAIFSVDDDALDRQTVSKKAVFDTNLVVLAPGKTTDLNGDGTTNYKDVGVMMLNIFGDDTYYDLNGDGSVDRSDLNIILDVE